MGDDPSKAMLLALKDRVEKGLYAPGAAGAGGSVPEKQKMSEE